MEFELNGAKMKYENKQFYRFKARRWKLKTMTNCNGYNIISITTDKIKKLYYVHRIVYSLYNPEWKINNPKLIIDHDDRNKLNNDISNLRDLTQQENCFNTDAKGYTWHRQTEKYKAGIDLNGQHIHLGYFDTTEEAHQAYLNAKAIYHVIEVR
jgi:hypothetical protein